MNYTDRLRIHYQRFQEAGIFEKLDMIKMLVTDLNKQILTDQKRDCEAVIIQMIRDVQQALAPEEYEQHKALLTQPKVDWLTGVEFNIDESIHFLKRLRTYCQQNRFVCGVTTEDEDDGLLMLTTTFDEKFSSVAREKCLKRRHVRDDDRELITIY